jgi:hypothetical protein
MGPNGVEKSFEWLCLFCKCVIKRSWRPAFCCLSDDGYQRKGPIGGVILI